MTAKRKNMDIYVLLASVAIIAYFFFVATPYGNRHGFFSEASMPEDGQILPYFLMTTPPLAVYILFCILSLKRIAYLRWLNYPLMIFNIHLFSLFCLSAFNGGTIFWFVLITGPITLMLMVVFLIIGLIKDLKYLRGKRDQ
ncbi:hypothetical protein [Paenibacillus pedocola]|uniref:hypothetical protein n=1 Tax=Paenibacillus pedocola TaxID=3242193 RepID=UPI002877A7C9|nr:hypothetical protein [Paenibacillus typhae]